MKINSQQQEKISIILPIYNAEVYLESTIKSIQEQTYLNWELIVIDDGSKDNSLKVLEEIARKDNRIICFHKENGGSSQARNFGLSKATGNFIAFIDDDDKLEPDFLDTLFKAIIEYRADVAMCNIIQNNGTLEYPWKEIDFFKSKESVFDEYAKGGICNRVWNKLYRREVIENIFFEEDRQLGEDALWTPQVMEKVNSLIRLPQGYYHYVIRNNSLSHGGLSDDKSQLEYLTNALMGASIILKYATNYEGREKRLKETIANCVHAVSVNLDFRYFNTDMIAQELIKQNRDIYDHCATRAERNVLQALELGLEYTKIVLDYRKDILLYGSIREKNKVILKNAKRLVKKVFQNNG
ncbi:glycosyltransferase family 2 protein [Streptococcus infantarius]|uniref:glycosyltransferase family 2 protein n=1 Tax=Streptococcus infantarius TaxID=102684 RepID=UPI0022E83875|nr:glycosyltransferase [Streptococcus infantarius]